MNIEKVHRKNRKAISPVLATVILIAITLIAAVAIATFVFGIFGTSASPATLSIPSSTVACWNTAGTGTAPTVNALALTAGTCAMVVNNGGTTLGSINGAGPASGTVTFAISKTAPLGGASAAATSASIPANGGYEIILTATGTMSSGQSITGFLTQSNGPNLAFVVIVT